MRPESDPNNEWMAQEQGDKEEPGPRDQLPRCSFRARADDGEEIFITGIRATDVALGLRRVPASFYTIVHHSGFEWKTDYKRSSVGDDIIEWSGSIPLPSDLSVNVCLEVYASFESQPVLGNGEQLRELAITMEQLLDYSINDISFTLSPRDGDVVSSCSTIMVTIERRKCESDGSSKLILPGSRRSTMRSQSKLEEATNQGHAALSCYRKYGKRQDLECSVEEFERALNICSSDHPCRAAAQSNLAMAKFILSQVKGTDISFHISISLYRSALAARPVGHPDRQSTLIQLAAVYLVRFQKQQDEVEVVEAEALLHEATELGFADSYENRAAIFLLRLSAERRMGHAQVNTQSSAGKISTSLSTDEDLWTLSCWLLDHFQQFGDLADLQQAITHLEEFIESTLVSDHRYCVGLAKLSMALSYRFDHLGDLSDLEDAISRQRDAVDLTPYAHPKKPVHLNNLGSFLRARFGRMGELGDLEDAISKHREAVDLTPHGHPDRPAHLNSLGNSLSTRFRRLGEPGDLEDAVLMQRNAVDLTPDGHPDKPTHLNNLGNSIFIRFELFGALKDLEDAISIQRDAVNLTPHGNSNRSAHLNNLGNSLFTRFQRLGESDDLDCAILIHRDAVNLIPDSHLDKPAYLNNLGNSVLTRFESLGQLEDLEDAISRYKDAVDLTLPDHPSRPARLSNLGSSFRVRFGRLGEMRDLDNAISMHCDAVSLTPLGHPDKPAHLADLSNSIFTRFWRFGELRDLEDAISMQTNAVELTPHGRPEMPGYLNNLGSFIRARFGHLGQLYDLEDAISRHSDATDLTPHGHPAQSVYLNNLGNSFLTRFERLGELGDLEDAVSKQRDAVHLISHGHPDRSTCLNNLGNSMVIRFEHLGELGDLEGAISMQREAVELTPHGHPDKPAYLNNLGNSCLALFRHLGELRHLEDAILMQRDAVDLTPYGHPDKSTHMASLANSFFTRFEHAGEPGDLEDAILMLREAVDLTPHGHPDKPARLNILGSSLSARFKHIKELSDLEGAISSHKDAVDLTPHGHPDKPAYLNDLGDGLVTRFEYLGELSDFEQAISLYSDAASASTGPVTARFFASQKWIACARSIRHHTLLPAYSVAIDLLPQLAWIGLPLTHRYSELVRAADVVREAAVAALNSGLPETAVEWLEQGRSIIWGDLFQLRGSYEELMTAHPDYAVRLRELSDALEHAGSSREKSLSALSKPRRTQSLHRAPEPLQEEADRHRALAIRRDKLLDEIRRLPDFQRFLLRKEFSQLRASAHTGPVVILNAAESRCDALIVLYNADRVLHVPLPSFTVKQSAGLYDMIKNAHSLARAMYYDERAGESVTPIDISWELLLSTLWKNAVKPVLDALGFSSTGDLSRIFWCPTGPFVFLPLHAAGLYDTQYSQPGHKAFDFVISSYTPTLSILIPQPEPDTAPGSDLRLLIVGQPPSDGLSRLPGVDEELQYIKEVINLSSVRTSLLASSVGTVEEVLSLMMQADWVHFSCHGIQDAASPTESGLCLADQRRLKLSDIISLSRPRGGLAFLSACQTAMGDQGLSDEAIHIAAGMLFAGYRGVIGTMWSVSDRFMPRVARDVYQQLLRNGGKPDYREAAWALHQAVEHLRDSGVPFVEWLPLIHIGL